MKVPFWLRLFAHGSDSLYTWTWTDNCVFNRKVVEATILFLHFTGLKKLDTTFHVFVFRKINLSWIFGKITLNGCLPKWY